MRRFLPLVCLCTLLTPAFSLDLSVSALFNYDLVRENGTLLLNQKKVSDLAYVGFVLDVPVSDTQGILLPESVKFEDADLAQTGGGYNKNIHWDGNILTVWHPRGYETIFDPYLTAGLGCSGAVFFDDRSRDYRTRTQIVIFPEAGAGFNLRIQDLLAGASLRTQILSFNPSPLKTYEQFPVAMTLNFGVRL